MNLKLESSKIYVDFAGNVVSVKETHPGTDYPFTGSNGSRYMADGKYITDGEVTFTLAIRNFNLATEIWQHDGVWYGDLMSTLPKDTSMKGYCEPKTYEKWENTVAYKKLSERSVTVVKWVDGIRDAVGPLSRMAIVDFGVCPEATRVQLIYG